MIGIITISAQAAADAFGTIAAYLRGDCRVQILTVAGLAAYVDGDGAAAGIAFETASVIGVNEAKKNPCEPLLGSPQGFLWRRIGDLNP